MSQQEDKDFSVLDEKTVASPVVENEPDVDAEQQPVVTSDDVHVESDDVHVESVVAERDTTDSEPQVISAEEIDEDDEEVPVKAVKSSRGGWKWNLINSALGLGALGACGYILLVGQPVHNAGDNKMLSQNVTALSNSVAAFQNEIAGLATELNSKATSESFLQLSQELTSFKNNFGSDIQNIQLALEDTVSVTNLDTTLASRISKGVSHSDLDRVKNDSDSAVRKVTRQLDQLTQQVSSLNQLVSTQSSQKYVSNYLSAVELIDYLEGNELLSTDLLDGEPYAVFVSSESGAFIAKEKDTVGRLTITKIRTDSVEVRTNKYDVGTLNTSARVK